LSSFYFNKSAWMLPNNITRYTVTKYRERMHTPRGNRQGFTLIELSIARIIIGLIIGGILVGQDMMGAAATRAQITQIEKFNSAANTFYGKYGGLPGDLNSTLAVQFGFAARGLYAGEGDGDGIIEGVTTNAPASTMATLSMRERPVCSGWI
jgi:prepilin-type N-terminal cleavage/methylation domain-containing protein